MSSTPSRIRGVNLGGWLVLDRVVTPYLFALTECQLEEVCWHPHQLSAPKTNAVLCEENSKKCRLVSTSKTWQDANDEAAFQRLFEKTPNVGRLYLESHFEHFVTRQDLQDLKNAGITHVRVPIPTDIASETASSRWLYLVRLCSWCRALNLQVWTVVYSNHCPNDNDVMLLNAIQDILGAMEQDGLTDVLTGFGLWIDDMDCDTTVLSFYDQVKTIVKESVGDSMAVIVGDVYDATLFNTGDWWTTPQDSTSLEVSNHKTYLDSHYSHAYAQRLRELSPRQHIAYVCSVNHKEITTSCCYQDPPDNTQPSQGVQRIVGEWSALYDTLPRDYIKTMLEDMVKDNSLQADAFQRNLTVPQQDFLKHFVTAQIMTYEQTAKGWFFNNFKTETMAEMDFLKGVRQGWIPSLDDISYESCNSLIFQIPDDVNIVHEYPDPDDLSANAYKGDEIDDELVLTHGQSWSGAPMDDSEPLPPPPNGGPPPAPGVPPQHGDSTINTSTEPLPKTTQDRHQVAWFPLFAMGFMCLSVWHVFFRRPTRPQYLRVNSREQLAV